MPHTHAPAEGRCRRCGQPRPVFPAEPSWGKTPTPLCSPCWSAYAEARAQGTYLDYRDAFNNASDEELEAGLTRSGITA